MKLNRINTLLIEKIFKTIDSNYSIVKFEELVPGRINNIYKITVKTQQYKYFILRIRRLDNKGFKQGFGLEGIIANKLDDLGINNYQKSIYTEYSIDSYGFYYSILEYIPGETLDQFSNKEILYNTGQILAKIHTIESNCLGKLCEKKSTLDDSYSYYMDYFDKVLKDLEFYNSELASKVYKFVIENFSMKYYSSIKPTLLHNDFHMKNVIVTPYNDIKLIDWDCSRYAHSEIEFIKFRHLSNDRNNKNNFYDLLNGYKEIKKIEITPNFFIHEIIWFCRMYVFEEVTPNTSPEYFPGKDYYLNKILEYCQREDTLTLYEEWKYELQLYSRKY